MPYRFVSFRPARRVLMSPGVLLLPLLVLCLTGCTATLYSPVSHHVPVPQETGEFRLSAQMLAPENYAVQGSMSPLPHVLVHGSLQRDVPGDPERHRFGDVGAGVYTTFVPDGFGDLGMTVSALGSWGRGTVAGTTDDFLRRPTKATADIERTAVQVDGAIWYPADNDRGAGQFFATGTMRVSRVQLTDLRFNATERVENQNGVFMSPGMQLGYQIAGVRAYGTAGIVLPIEEFRNTEISYRPLFFGLRLSVDLFYPLRK